ncbi:MAG: hypothetical protein IT202_01590 [Fimbriimonadaceae bacterium]|nr:hypothetical protein [Fimbriimonadaceae bacterium]MCC6351184.1 hypothetical protein [Fimbriimonadaceae bacterium]
MKLNLLPTHVSKEAGAKTAWVFSLLIAAASIGAAVFLQVSSRQQLSESIEAARQNEGTAAQALRLSQEADAIIAQARGIIINIDLADAMMAHNNTYPDLYDEVRRYVPSFFRTTSLSASPSGADTCVVTMTGVIRTYQDYANLMLALMRIPGAQSVSRDGYQIIDPVVPSLNETDQTGRPIRPGESNIPDDPTARLNYLMSQGGTTGFSGVGGFGSDSIAARGAMPDWSQITVSVVLQRNLQTPDPRATIAGAQGGGGGGTAPGGGIPGPTPAGGGGGGGPSVLME